MENPVARMLAAWCYNLGAIFYSRGDRKSGAVRSRSRPRALGGWMCACACPVADVRRPGPRRARQTVRSKISGHSGAVLVFPEGTTQAYGSPMVDIMRNGAIEAAFEARKVLQPVRFGCASLLWLCSLRWRELCFRLCVAPANRLGAARR